VDAPEFLPPEGEKAWTFLRRHLDRSRAFWLGFLLTEDLRAARVLRERAGFNRKLRAERFVTFLPETADELAGLLDRLEAEAPGPPGCAWVEAIHVADRRWDEAWERLLQALNHRRDSLRDRLGGLVLAAPRSTKSAAQRLSSDLWSVRDLVLDLPVGVAGAVRTPAEAPGSPPVPEPAVARAVEGLRLGNDDVEDDVDAVGEEAVEEAVALLALPPSRLATTERERTVAAIAAARQRGDDQLAGVLLLGLADGYVEERDWAGAHDLVQQVLALTGIDPPTRLRALELGIDVAMTVGDPDEAERHADERLVLSERLAEATPTPEALRDLSISLNNVGRVQEARGDWAAAEAAYTRSLQLRERLAEATPTPEALRDLSVSLDNVGRVQEARGDWAAAEAAYTRSLQLAERLAEATPTPEALRDLSISLNNVARAREAAGDEAAAAALRERAATLDAQLEADDAAGEVAGGTSG
jgi:tetratricopeptide (TPR) repeat protein